MASAALVDDRLQIDGFDAYTWTNTFGIPTGGFHRDFMDHGFTSGICEEPSEETEPIAPDVPMLFFGSGTHASADAIFPARKYEYDDGRVTYARPGLPASLSLTSETTWLFGCVLAALAFLFILSRMRK
jgi:hypothetical protein